MLVVVVAVVLPAAAVVAMRGASHLAYGCIGVYWSYIGKVREPIGIMEPKMEATT